VEEAAPAAIKACVMCNRQFTEDTTFCPHDGGLLTPLKPKVGLGTIIAGRYEIVGSIGDGGMGEVFQARDRMLKRFVALKMLKSHFNSSQNALKRFQQEAEAVSSLNHPNIVGIHDFGIADTSQPFIVMDYVNGISLESAIHEQSFPSERARKIFLQICSALMHAHQRGIVHRDVKPNNVLLTELDGEHDVVKVIDFGIAKLIDSTDGHSLTATGEVFGSPQYMSPEQCRGERPDERSDIYSFGCLMYRTLSGRLPFTAADISGFIYKHVHETVPPLTTTEFHLPPDLEQTIFRCLQKDPAARFQSMQEVKDALSATAPTAPRVKPAASPRGSKRTRMRIALITLLLVVLTAAGGYWAFKTTGPSPKQHPKLSEQQIKQIMYSDKAWAEPARKARTYWYAGDYMHAIPFAQQANERAKSYPPDDPRTAFSEYILGVFDWAQGDYESARKKLEESLAIRRQIYASRAPEIADTEVSLAVTLADLGDYKRAQELIDDSSSIRADAFGANSLQVAETMYAAGYLAGRQHNYERAVKLLTEALYTVERTKSATKADIADSTVDLADAYKEWGNYSTAEILYKRALAAEKTETVPAKLYVAKAYSGLANVYAKRKNYALAHSNADEAIKHFDNQLGPVNTKSAEMRKLIDDIQGAAN
jgi:serine/threonine protein kinase